ncbi:MAG: hypothetical protein KVP17_002050 [Porospora cf. gigantea B]|uniref:uncharacterized protein n=1 Tax=Porospora cf. gigantea B TaxID=2853592 RepID=UPI003571E6BE|nr:MAG: hypothetical protein KVP17_002050 [Porospora cf. gigantea B]
MFFSIAACPVVEWWVTFLAEGRANVMSAGFVPVTIVEEVGVISGVVVSTLESASVDFASLS